MRKFNRIDEVPMEILVNLNILIEQVRYHPNMKKNWYRFRFSEKISDFKIAKLFSLANQFGYLSVNSEVNESLKTEWTCIYIKSLESNLLILGNFPRKSMPADKKSLKLKIMQDYIERNPDVYLIDIAKDLKMSYRSAKTYYDLLLKENPNLKNLTTEKKESDSSYSNLKKIINEAAWLFLDIELWGEVKNPIILEKIIAFKNKHLSTEY